MVSIYFQSRKYEEVVNCSFILFDGNQVAPSEGFAVGDEFVLLFDISQDMYEAVSCLERPDFRVYRDTVSFLSRGFKGSAHIPFVVFKKTHVCSMGQENRMRLLSQSIYLQAQSGYWEDLFLWIALGTVPPWAIVPKGDRTEDEQ